MFKQDKNLHSWSIFFSKIQIYYAEHENSNSYQINSLNVRYESLYEFSLLTAKAGLQVIVQLPPCLLFHNLLKSKIIK